MPRDVKNALSQVGLKAGEVDIYLALLSNKQGLFVAEIAKTTGIKRSTVNLMLERLREKGFVTYHLDGARRLFSAESPEALLFRFENPLGDLRTLIPLLHATTGHDKKTKIRFFEGREGVETILNDILFTLKITRGSKREYLAISSGENVFETQPDHQKQFVDKRVKAGIPLRWIAPESSLVREMDKRSNVEFRKVKFFNAKKYKFTIEFDIYADKIALMTFGKNPTGVIVENETLADSCRGLFNLLWDSLR